MVVDAYLSSGVVMDCRTRLLPIKHDVDTAQPLGVLKTMASLAPEYPSRDNMVSQAPKDRSLEVAIVTDVPALSTLDRVDIS